MYSLIVYFAAHRHGPPDGGRSLRRACHKHGPPMAGSSSHAAVQIRAGGPLARQIASLTKQVILTNIGKRRLARCRRVTYLAPSESHEAHGIRNPLSTTN